jgi:UDP-N-acetyl-D-mannosaminuronic acid transferase (WecB/TagA/CpsF family)
LLDRGEGRRHQHRVPADQLQVLDLAVAIDNGAQHHVALNPRRFGECRINWLYALNQQPSRHTGGDANALRHDGNKFRHRSQVG